MTKNGFRAAAAGCVLGLTNMLVPAHAAAQDAGTVSAGLTVTPRVGVFWAAPHPESGGLVLREDDTHPGLLLGIGIVYGVAPGWRATGEVARVRVRGVGRLGTEANHFTFGTAGWAVAAGAERDVLAGPLSVALGLQAGAAWIHDVQEARVGNPDAGTAEAFFTGRASPDFFLRPTLSLARRIGVRAALEVGVRDDVNLSEGSVHNPSATVGLRIGAF